MIILWVLPLVASITLVGVIYVVLHAVAALLLVRALTPSGLIDGS